MMLLGNVKENPKITPKEIMNIMDKKFSVKIPYGRAWGVRERAKELIFENIEKSYSYVPALKSELVTRNPRSHVDYLLEGDRAFQRMFVPFKSCIQGFKLGCRRFLGL